MPFEIFYDLIFGKWCFVSVFESRSVPNVDATDPVRSKEIQFSQNFGKVNFERKKESDIVPFCMYETVINAYGLCLNVRYLNVKTVYSST